jgi:molybdopterin converting factor small subunit
MVKITVKFISIARQRAGTGRVELTVASPKLRIVVNDIVNKYHIKDLILAESGDIKPWARVLVNGRSQDFVGGLDIELHDGDTLALVYPYADNF